MKREGIKEYSRVASPESIPIRLYFETMPVQSHSDRSGNFRKGLKGLDISYKNVG